MQTSDKRILMEDSSLEGEIRGIMYIVCLDTGTWSGVRYVQAESANGHDRYAVSTLQNGSVVGHVPQSTLR